MSGSVSSHNVNESKDVVYSLTKKPFVKRSYAEKLQLIQTGRPNPPLPHLKVEQTEKARASYTRTFNTNSYKKYVWLTGSTTLNKLFCWPCLLFNDKYGPWSHTGFNNLNSFVTACDRHQASENHIKAFTTLQTFGTQGVDHALNLQNSVSDSIHNEKVKENKAILKRLIDVVIFLGKQECPFSCHEPDISNSKGMYVQLLKFLSDYDPTLANHLKTAAVFKETLTLPSIQNDLIDSVLSAIHDQIRQEIVETSFVAILLDETTDKLSTTVRYVDKNGVCHERFLSFKDVSEDRTAEGLFKALKETVTDLNCSGKIVADTFDGVAIAGGDTRGLQTLIKNEYPMASFVHCYAHRLNLILSKCTLHIRACNQFFITLQGFQPFFSHSTSINLALKTFMEKKFPGVAPTKWNFTSRVVNTVRDYRIQLVDFFLSIEEKSGEWTSDVINKASGFIYFLSKVETKFLLNVFCDIFLFSDELFDFFQSKSLDIAYCIHQVNGFYEFLQKFRNSGFDKVWRDSLVDEENVGQGASGLPSSGNETSRLDKQKYSELYFEVLDTLMYQTKFRVESLNQVQFMKLLDTSIFFVYSETFPEDLLLNLKNTYSKHFDLIRLKKELKVFYCIVELKNKSLTDLIAFMKTNSLDIVYEEVHKLAQLILTYPSTIASSERSFSAVNRINDYLESTRFQSRLSNLAMLSIEKDLLVQMKKDPEEFYANVIENFTKSGSRPEFMYK